jgi:hypothetical protein
VKADGGYDGAGEPGEVDGVEDKPAPPARARGAGDPQNDGSVDEEGQE